MFRYPSKKEILDQDPDVQTLNHSLDMHLSSSLMKHLWIIEKISSRLVYYHDFEGNCELDGILISGLLSALQSFSEYELQEQGIESIDMGGLRWVYSSFPSSNLLIVVAGSKKINPALTLERIRIIHNMFTQEYEIDDHFWKTWDSLVSHFYSFRTTIDTLHDQWYKAQMIMDVGRLFDLLRIFQELFIQLIQIIEDHVPKYDRYQFLTEISNNLRDLEYTLQNHQTHEYSDTDRIIDLFLPQIDLSLQTINFSRTQAMKLYSLNPIGFDEFRLRSIFFPVFQIYIQSIKAYIGDFRWNVTSKKRIVPFLLKNWEFLENLRVLKKIFTLFMQ